MKYRVIIPQGVRPTPQSFEISAADILLDYFKCDIEFLPTNSDKTPDFIANGKKYEVKSPVGNSKNTVETQLKRALKQSQYIVFDARRSKRNIAKIRTELNYNLKLRDKTVKSLILITKSGKIEILK